LEQKVVEKRTILQRSATVGEVYFATLQNRRGA